MNENNLPNRISVNYRNSTIELELPLEYYPLVTTLNHERYNLKKLQKYLNDKYSIKTEYVGVQDKIIYFHAT